ncbi:MAG TPA: CsbD family protein [Thermoanaerobaculia bacterium]|nr:CsbD family protein [Thermoanaerobaculia bacterium]
MTTRADGLWDMVKGNWKQLKGRVREKWGLLTDDDLEQIAGHKDRLVGKIQEKYGEAKWNNAQIEEEVRRMNPPDTTPR